VRETVRSLQRITTAIAGVATPEEFKSMTSVQFPHEAEARRAVLVLKELDIEMCSYEPGAAKALLDEEAYVLQFPVRVQGECHAALQNILDSGLARPGSMLVQSPYDADTYVEASQAPQSLALAKYMYFSTLCMHLGAKEVSVVQIDLRTRTGKTSIDAKGERVGVGVEGSVERDELEKIRSKISLSDEFTGGAPDIAASERLLKRTGLWSDSNMRALIEMRREGSNQLMSRKLLLHLSSEAKSNLNVVSRINVPACVQISADYKKATSEQHDYELTVFVRF
jgi:hypothetical protein